MQGEKKIKEEIVDRQTRNFVRRKVEEIEKAKESLRRCLITATCEKEREEIYKLWRKNLPQWLRENL